MEIKLFVFLISINVLSVLSFGNFEIYPGPSSCTVSNMPGMQLGQIMRGTCYPSLICYHKGGEAIGRCGITDVCCIFPRSCGYTTAHNSTYFINRGFPLSYNDSDTCLFTIQRIPGRKQICQLRLDFIEFELTQPNKGECDTDFFTINGQNLNSVVPKICGFNSGQHYIDSVQGPINLNVQTYGPGQRRWNILVSQIECDNPSKAPSNCLQYFMGPNGEMTTLNFHFPNSGDKRVGYMNNLDYSICFRKEQYFCTQTYFINGSNSVNTLNEQSFSISSEWVASGIAGSGIIECPTDYLLLNGVRFCGSRLNSRAVKQNNLDYNEDITDEGTGPFIARFVSDNKWSDENSRGFKIGFKQNPCLLQFPNSVFSIGVEHKQESNQMPKLYKQLKNSTNCNIFNSKEEI